MPLAARAHPFELGIGPLAAERFPRVRADLAGGGNNPRDRDAFVLLPAVAELLRELRPDAGVGSGVETLVAFLHAAYLFWEGGAVLRSIGETQLASVLTASRPTVRPSDRPTSYVQLPALRVWATPIAGQPPEPLDGWFVTPDEDRLGLLAIFGLSPARAGFTAVELAGPHPALGARADGTPLFASTLAGPAASGLASLEDEAELLELAWRVETLP
jgi:hypothetical protein